MGREIKFRAWVGKTGSMIPEFLSFGANEWKITDWHTSVDVERRDVTLMQYTGLKDKNGVEIYEGDIVCGEHTQARVEIFWNQASAKFQGRVLSKHGDGTHLSMGLLAARRKVIGNIYEAPELLNSDQPAGEHLAAKPIASPATPKEQP